MSDAPAPSPAKIRAALSRPLRLGDQEQIAALKAYAEYEYECPQCGDLQMATMPDCDEFGEFDMETDGARCRNCWKAHYRKTGP